MTPKEKAKELYNRFDMIIYTDQDHYNQVKQCALICIKESKKYATHKHYIIQLDQIQQEIEKL